MSYPRRILYCGLVLLFAVAAHSQVLLGYPACPVPSSMQNFTMEKFLGTWYEISSTPNSFEEGGIRITHTFKAVKDGEVDLVIAMDSPWSDKVTTIHANIYSADESFKTGKFSVVYKTSSGTINESNLVLDTDYTTYAAIWSCQIQKVMGSSMTAHKAWILGRQKIMRDPEVIRSITKKLEKVQMPTYLLKETSQCSNGSLLAASVACVLVALGSITAA